MSQPPDDSYRVPALRTRIAAGILDFSLVLAAALVVSRGYRGFLIFPLLFVGYHTASVWLAGRTPAKALLGLKVRRCGSPATLLWSLGRSSLGLLLVNGLGLGIVVALFNRRRRAVHDYVFSSVVVLEEQQLDLGWPARLKAWLKEKNESYAKKAELVTILSGIWNFLAWLTKQLDGAAALVERLVSFLRRGSDGAPSASLPAATSVTQSAAMGVAATTAAVTIVTAVPGAAKIAAYIASPVYQLTRPSIEGVASTVPAPGGMIIHHAIRGVPVLVKAIVDARPGEGLRYTLDFGDGSQPVTKDIAGPFISEAHMYPADDSRTRYIARLRVTNADGHEIGHSDYSVEFVEATEEARIVKALDDALWVLNVQQKRESPADGAPAGHWEHSSPIAATALAALAFQVNGFDSRAGAGNPYRQTVDRALRYLLARCQTVAIDAQPAGNPDANGNGIGITFASQHVMYELPMAVMALVASGDPARLATAGPEHVRGRHYDEIVADMVDYLAFAQSDPSSSGRGGWRYGANSGEADLSVTQWPVLAMMAAEREWGIAVPDWVKGELRDHFLTRDQDPATGGFDYDPRRGWTGVGMTAAGLMALGFADVPADDPRVQGALAYIAGNWDRRNLDYYYMYAVMKAAKLHDPPVERFGEHDWLAEYAKDLTSKQRQDGTWPERGHIDGIMATTWPVLILSRDIFATGLQMRWRRWAVQAFQGG
jgi:uncharacterized RDD family membrane protein YckC